MSSKNPVNIAASVLAKLRNLAAQRGWNYTHVRNTFERSRIPMPSSPPVVWKSEFGSNPVKHTQWAAFLNRNPRLDVPTDFNEVVACVAQFLTPLFFPAAPKPTRWIPGQGWIM